MNSGTHRAIGTERSTWKNHIATALFVAWPLANISRRDVKAWVEALGRKKALTPAAWKVGGSKRTTRTLSRQTVLHALNLLRRCLADAIDDEHLRGNNPAKDVRVAKKPSTDEGWTYLTADEVPHLLNTESVPLGARLLYTVAIYSGLRQGELSGLRWDDVHLDATNPELVVRFSHRRGPRRAEKSGTFRFSPQPAMPFSAGRTPAPRAPRAWSSQRSGGYGARRVTKPGGATATSPRPSSSSDTSRSRASPAECAFTIFAAPPRAISSMGTWGRAISEERATGIEPATFNLGA